MIIAAAVLIALPSFMIQNFWNSIVSANIVKDMSIEIWQASLLWGALVSLLYMTGIFQFKLDFKSLESIDVESINDPELRAEIENMQLKTQEAKKSEPIKDPSKKDDYNI
ncbi:MAG: hypothetical protein O3C63_00690 [Cyanobacteria bacterium]|nr:hypothetical protein [Cyanobacteriota bacterium]MDA1020250.1 hypothetical protein [Cyanobacteriota bacterium]